MNNPINSGGRDGDNASCTIVIEDQADQVGSANDFTCNGVSKKRKASAITDFVINAIGFLCRNAKIAKLLDGGAYSAPPYP